RLGLGLVAIVLVAAAASCGDTATVVTRGGGGGGAGGAGGDGGDTFSGGGPSCPDSLVCGEDCCVDGVEFCALGTQCAPDQGPCTSNDDCWFDSYCLEGQCIPYGVPPDTDHD